MFSTMTIALLATSPWEDSATSPAGATTQSLELRRIQVLASGTFPFFLAMTLSHGARIRALSAALSTTSATKTGYFRADSALSPVDFAPLRDFLILFLTPTSLKI